MATLQFGEIAERLRRSTVLVSPLESSRRGSGGGSGVVWTSGGVIMTNAHVARADRAMVTLWDGQSLEGRVVQRDARRDLAEIQVSGNGLPAATIGASAALRPGELVVAVGNPLGFIGAVSTGVVHSRGRIPGVGPQTWLAAAVRLAPGNSGGPLADARGHVVGINTMITSGGLALAVPADAVERFREVGPGEPRMGVTVRPVRAGARIGLLVLEVTAGSPAERASLLPGDLLLAAAGRPFESAGDLAGAIAESGSAVHLQFQRGGVPNPRHVTLVLPERKRRAA